MTGKTDTLGLLVRAPVDRYVVAFPGYTIGACETKAEADALAKELDNRGNAGKVRKVTM